MVGRKWWTVINGKKMTAFGMNRRASFVGVSGIILVLLALVWRSHRAPVSEQALSGEDEQAMVIEVAGGEFVEFRQSDKLFNVSAEVARKEVVEAMKHAWGSYVKHAWGKDELAPLSRVGVETFGGCTGITIVDAADSLYIMGLKEEFEKARSWIAGVDFNCVDEDVSAFETTIRSLGGLMSLYELTDDKVFLEKAESLGNSLRHSFDEKHTVPSNSCNLKQKDCHVGSRASIAGIGTSQLEWRALAYHTRKRELKQAAKESQCVMMGLMNASPPAKLAPTNVSPAHYDERDLTGGELDKLCPNHRHFRLSGNARTGAEGDSYYEYLLKVYLQGGSSEGFYREEFDRQVRMLFEHHVEYEWPVRLYDRKGDAMQHLACFFPGAIALGVMTNRGSLSEGQTKKWTEIAEGVAESCYLMYHITDSGLSGDSSDLNPKGARSYGPYLQRPEVIEAQFYLWRHTKDPKYRAYAWKIFEAIQKHTKVPAGYCGLATVNGPSPTKKDSMESFFLAETLKYLYLIFSDDDVLPLDEWVFNTEAHPLKIRDDLVSKLA
ncbi:hypothetical protein NDN08_005189 [Rhodosorus marinus]|uniref:alpha-1,2-Mannosidase n=1 Tax=Rhodosorus marinus TaxID=101924 RepID=A0AAV8V0U2_9RHOD|nr:hypothetical protein NDN08_005189 [Rhodosorus marinus]